MTVTAKCTPHEGRHGVDYMGRCFVPARDRRDRQPYRWRFVTCETCGVSLDIRTDRVSGASETLLAGTDRPHRHEPPITVALDPEALASAIVAASRAARQERAPQRREPEPMEPQSTMSGRQPVPSRQGLGSIPEFAE